MTTSFNLRLFSQHKTPAAAVIQHYLCCSLNVHNVDFPSMQSSFFFISCQFFQKDVAFLRTPSIFLSCTILPRLSLL